MHDDYFSRFKRSPFQRIALIVCIVLLAGCSAGHGVACGDALTCVLQTFPSTTQAGTGTLDANVTKAVTPSFTFSDPDPFSYVNWGPWASKNLGVSTVGIAAPSKLDTMSFGGQATPESSMPNNGSATYAGRTLANYASGGAVQGTVTLNANFGKSTVDVNIFHEDGHTLTYGGAVIWHNGYSNFSTDGSRVLHGAFFGPNAQETSGTYSWTSPNYSVTGSYGAKLCSPGATVC